MLALADLLAGLLDRFAGQFRDRRFRFVDGSRDVLRHRLVRVGVPFNLL